MSDFELHKQSIFDILRMIDKAANDSRCLPSLLLAKARFWTPGERPKRFNQLTPRQCFGNAQLRVLKDYREGRVRFTYVEGYACSGSLGFPFPTHHGWLVDDMGTVIDQTWESPQTSTYFGIPINTEYLVEKSKKHGPYMSVFDNHKDQWEVLRNPSLLNSAIMEWDTKEMDQPSGLNFS